MQITDEDVQEKRSLVKVPDGFSFEVFAAPPEVNYPAAITATPGGRLFVAVDKNGSLDQELGRGQILEVFDEDGDGRGDHYTVFVDSIDSPRGLVYDGERLFVMHPPTLTAYRDVDGDGVADTSRDLVTGLGYGLDFRGADHTTNGMQMGIDGWLYVAVGDYGFAEAVGTDASTIHSRGGAIVRVRPDGSELEIYASGLRNPYDVTFDPFMHGFERGNTNDGHGWRIRLQHVVPQAKFGYPTLFRHFADEVKPPLADYGWGSGAGALYVDAPHLPDSLARALYTVDWGRSAVFRHRLRRAGASFEPTQQTFLQIPQPTDITIDGSSRLYVSSWVGASFTYTGEDVGFVARLTHRDADPGAPVDFEGADRTRLVELLASPHALYRRHAQRELLRRDSGPALADALAELARSDESLEGRVAALYTLKQLEGRASHSVLLELAQDPRLREHALRALADRRTQLENVPASPFVDALADENPRARLQAVNGLSRLNAAEAAPQMLSLTADPDRTVAHVAVQSLVELEAVRPALDALRTGSPGMIDGAIRVLQQLHAPETVTGLIELEASAIDPYLRRRVLAGLARLYHRPAEWHGESWWGTTPSTRGPYFEPVTWSESDRIRPVLAEALAESEGLEYRRRVHLFARNGAIPDGGGALLVAAGARSDSVRAKTVDALLGQASVDSAAIPVLEDLAARSPALRGAVTDLLLTPSELPAESAPFLRTAVLDETVPADRRAAALEAFSGLPDEETFERRLQLHAELLERDTLAAPVEEAIGEFLGARSHVRRIDLFTELTRSGSQGERRIAYAVLVDIAGTDWMDEGPRTNAREAIAAAWDDPRRTASLLWAIGYTEAEGYEDRVTAYLETGDGAVRRAARYAADRLGI